jgi:hypothetical protein
MIRENRKNQFFKFIPSLEHPTDNCWKSYESRKQEKLVFQVYTITRTPHRILLSVLWFAKTGKTIFSSSNRHLNTPQNSVECPLIGENRKNQFFKFIPSLEHPTEFCWVSYDSRKQEKLVFQVHTVTRTPHRILLNALWFAKKGKTSFSSSYRH